MWPHRRGPQDAVHHLESPVWSAVRGNVFRRGLRSASTRRRTLANEPDASPFVQLQLEQKRNVQQQTKINPSGSRPCVFTTCDDVNADWPVETRTRDENVEFPPLLQFGATVETFPVCPDERAFDGKRGPRFLNLLLRRPA